MTEKKESKPAQKQDDYEAMVRTRVENRQISLADRLYESVGKPKEDKNPSGKVCLSETVLKAGDVGKADNAKKEVKQE